MVRSLRHFVCHKGIILSAPYGQTSPFLTSLRMPQGHLRLSSLRSNKSVPSSLRMPQGHLRLSSLRSNKSVPSSLRMPQGHQRLSSLRRTSPFLTSLRMPQGHHPLSSLRSNNAHAIGIGIHCDMHGKDFSWRKREGAVRAETASSRATCIIDIGKPLRDFLMSFHDTQSSIHASKFYRPMACA